MGALVKLPQRETVRILRIAHLLTLRELVLPVLDNLRHFVRHNLLVVGVLHGELADSLGASTQVRDEPEHPAQRRGGDDDTLVQLRLHRQHLASTLRQQTHHVRLVRRRARDLKVHDRLEQGSAVLLHDFPHHVLRSQVEGEVRRVDLVGLSALQLHVQTPDGGTQERSGLARFLERLLDALHEVVGEGSARHFRGVEAVLGGGVLRAQLRGGARHVSRHLRELSAAARLLLVAVVKLDLVAHRRGQVLAVLHERLAHAHGDVLFGHQTLHEDVKVELAHAGDGDVLRLVVDGALEGRVLLLKALELREKVLQVGDLRREERGGNDGDGDEDGLAGGHRLGHGVHQRVTRRALKGLDARNLTRRHLVHLDEVVRVQLHELVDLRRLRLLPVRAATGGDTDSVALLQGALVHADVRKRLVVHDVKLEHHRDQLLLRVRLQGHLLLLSVLHDDAVVVHLRRVRQELRHGVQHKLHAEVALRGPAVHGAEGACDGGAADGRLDVGGRDVLLHDVLLAQLLVDLGQLLDEQRPRLLHLLLEVCGDVAAARDVHAVRALERHVLAVDDVDDALAAERGVAVAVGHGDESAVDAEP
eukprot:Rhum_TRINITY_DN197_c0_g1::Rhum_TRINITY_DN197_c0_g1_i1::g.640::m.640